MSEGYSPVDIIQSLISAFENTGLSPKGLDGALAFLSSLDGDFVTWSTLMQRLYRYHDFCSMQLADLLMEGGESIVHLQVESARHEALAGAYRLAGIAIDSANPNNDKGGAKPAAIAEELRSIKARIAAIFWAFATKGQREKYIATLPDNVKPDIDSLGAIYAISPLEALDPMGEAAVTLEDVALELPASGKAFGRPIYPPLHAAADYKTPASEETSDKIDALSKLL